jgi:hypothetical protein
VTIPVERRFNKGGAPLTKAGSAWSRLRDMNLPDRFRTVRYGPMTWAPSGIEKLPLVKLFGVPAPAAFGR